MYVFNVYNVFRREKRQSSIIKFCQLLMCVRMRRNTLLPRRQVLQRCRPNVSLAGIKTGRHTIHSSVEGVCHTTARAAALSLSIGRRGFSIDGSQSYFVAKENRSRSEQLIGVRSGTATCSLVFLRAHETADHRHSQTVKCRRHQSIKLKLRTANEYSRAGRPMV